MRLCHSAFPMAKCNFSHPHQHLTLTFLYFIYWFIYFSSLIQYISTTASLFPLPPSISLLPWHQNYCSSVILEKQADLPVVSIERVTIRINKTRHIPPYQGWMRQPNRMKMVPRAGVRDTPTSTTKSLRKTQDKQFMQRI